MSETTTVAIVGIAAVGLVLFFVTQQSQQAAQQQTQALLLGKVLQPAPQANPLASLTSLVGPILSAL